MPQKLLNFKLENRGTVNFVTNTARKIHSARLSLKFNQTCWNEGLLPKYTYIKRSVISDTLLSPKEVRNLRFKKLAKGIVENERSITLNTPKLIEGLKIIESLLPNNITIENFERDMSLEIKKLESKNENCKISKLNKLRKHQNFEHEKVRVYNISQQNIPKEVLSSLSLGLELPIGGKFSKKDKIELLAEIDRLNEKWVKYANKLNISKYDLYEIRSRLYIFFVDITT